MITDLTQGSTRKMLWYFSIPMLLSVAFQQMYHIVDSIIAGKNALGNTPLRLLVPPTPSP